MTEKHTLSLKEQLDIGAQAKLYAENLIDLKKNKFEVSFIPTQWVPGNGGYIWSLEAIGLACWLISQKKKSHVTFAYMSKCNGDTPKESILSALKELSLNAVTQQLQNGDWLFTAPQPDGEMCLLICEE